MDISIQLPLDADGFLRRECPNCEQEFKWHHGTTDAAPTDFIYPDLYWCPRCGKSADHDSWWTTAQLEYQQQVVAGTATSATCSKKRSSRVATHLSRSTSSTTTDPMSQIPWWNPMTW